MITTPDDLQPVFKGLSDQIYLLGRLTQQQQQDFSLWILTGVALGFKIRGRR